MEGRKVDIRLRYEAVIDPATGMMSCFRLKAYSVDDITRTNDDDDIPRLSLERNRAVLNGAALSVTGLRENDRVSIMYSDGGVALLGRTVDFGLPPSSGNVLTRLGSFSFRGGKNATLMERGTSFNVSAWNEPGMFALTERSDDEGRTARTDAFLDVGLDALLGNKDE